MKSVSTHIKPIFSAIVIGVSAGGLHALIHIFEHLPADFPIPIIVVQHRGKDYKELLEQVLQTKCLLKVKQADEKEKIEAGYIYTAPADYHLLIELDKTFSLTSDVYVKYSRPSINLLFETAAEVYKKDLLGIILTGASSDGSEGLLEIKRNGGYTIAQNPEMAEYPYMPQSAIAIGAVEIILSLDDIKHYLEGMYERR
jgi:two-component system chemotaxis response regulator CheB